MFTISPFTYDVCKSGSGFEFYVALIPSNTILFILSGDKQQNPFPAQTIHSDNWQCHSSNWGKTRTRKRSTGRHFQWKVLLIKKKKKRIAAVLKVCDWRFKPLHSTTSCRRLGNREAGSPHSFQIRRSKGKLWEGRQKGPSLKLGGWGSLLFFLIRPQLWHGKVSPRLKNTQSIHHVGNSPARF